jgi:DNA-binding response OmpR family regulator
MEVTEATAAPHTGARRVLVVDDAPDLTAIVEPVLEREGFAVRCVTSGAEAIESVTSWRPHVVVLDVGLPDMDGLEVCRRIRTISDVYIVMLSARAEEADRLIGLSAGSDDYVTKPFSARELVLRIQAMLRRPRGTEGGTGASPAGEAPRRPLQLGSLEVRPATREALVEGHPVELTKLEFDILLALASRPDQVLERSQLMDFGWGGEFTGTPHVLDVHVSNLRRKLGDGSGSSSRFVRSIRGVGYRIGSGA